MINVKNGKWLFMEREIINGKCKKEILINIFFVRVCIKENNINF